MRISKKILTIILSISLLVVISCGDRPTGSTPAKGDALLNSVPKVTGNPTQDFSTDTTYNGTLTIVDTKEDTDFTDDFLKSYGESGSGTTREELIQQAKPLNVILTITKNTAGNNIVKLEVASITSTGEYKSESTLFENAELKKDSSGKYNAGEEKKSVDSGTEIYYIEFDTTTIKCVRAQKFDFGDTGCKYTYTGTLTKKN